MEKKSAVVPKYIAKDESMSTRVNDTYPTEIEFRTGVFYFELLLMVLYCYMGPLAYPVLYVLCGTSGMKMRDFYGKGFVLQFLVWVFTAVSTALVLIDGSKETVQELYWMYLIIFTRCVMIACKYSHMSNKYYKLVNKYSEGNKQILLDQQLGVSWLNLKEQIIVEQVQVAMKRNHVEKKNLIMDGLLLLDEDTCSLEPPPSVDGYELILSWIQNATKANRMNLKCFLPIGFFVAFSPLLVRIFCTNKDHSIMGKTTADTASLPLIWIVVFLWETSHFMFLYAAILDSQRRLHVMKKTSILIAPSHSHLRQYHIMKAMGCLDMELLHHSATTIHAWVNLRRVLIDFGKDYMKRLSAYFSITILMVAFAAVELYIEFNTTENDQGVAAYSISPNNASLVSTILVCIVYLIKLIHIGHNINKETIVQTDVLLEYSRIMERTLMTHSASLDTNAYRDVSTTLMALQTAREQLRVDIELRPFRIFGVPARAFLIKVVASICFSYTILLFRIKI